MRSDRLIDYIIGRPGRSADAWFPPPGKPRGSELWKLDQSARHAPISLRGVGPDDNVNLIHWPLSHLLSAGPRLPKVVTHTA